MIIVTGGAGFIGSCMVWKLNNLGRKDILIVDEKGDVPPKAANWNPRAVLDYLDKAELLRQIRKGKLDKVEAVFHMGACSATTEMNREYLRENNFLYTQALCEWALKNDSRFLYASSAATYGAGADGYSDADAVTPRLKPLNPYGESKQMFDLWLLQNRLERLTAGFKFFNVYGPNEYHKGDMRSVVHKGYQQIKKEGKIRLFKSYRPEFADGEQKRDFIYVKDVVAVMAWFWQNPSVNGIFNLGAGKAESWNALAHALFAALGKTPDIEYIEMPENIRNQYQYWTEADLTKLRQTAAPAAFKPLKDGVADYVRHLESATPYLTGS